MSWLTFRAQSGKIDALFCNWTGLGKVCFSETATMKKEGTYEELIEKDGVFAELVKKQRLDV